MKPSDNVKNLMARMKVANVPEDLRRDVEATLLDLKAAQIDARVEMGRRQFADPVAADDLGAALATCLLAASAAICKQMPGKMNPNQLLRDLQNELDQTKVVLRDPAGELMPAGRAVGFAAGMLRFSDPGIVTQDSKNGLGPEAPRQIDYRVPSAAEAVCAVARRLWRKNAAARLAKHAGSNKRAAAYWLEQGQGMSADALADLLRSEAGLEMLEGIMGNAKPHWWAAFRGVAERLESLRTEIEEARRGLRH